jgi:hypothetical protein
MIEKSIDADLRIGDPLLVVKAVPAPACDHFGKKNFTPAVTKKP